MCFAPQSRGAREGVADSKFLTGSGCLWSEEKEARWTGLSIPPAEGSS